jgi:hypothetical protein
MQTRIMRVMPRAAGAMVNVIHRLKARAKRMCPRYIEFKPTSAASALPSITLLILKKRQVGEVNRVVTRPIVSELQGWSTAPNSVWGFSVYQIDRCNPGKCGVNLEVRTPLKLCPVTKTNTTKP